MGFHLFRSLNSAAHNKATKLTDLLSGDGTQNRQMNERIIISMAFNDLEYAKTNEYKVQKIMDRNYNCKCFVSAFSFFLCILVFLH